VIDQGGKRILDAGSVYPFVEKTPCNNPKRNKMENETKKRKGKMNRKHPMSLEHSLDVGCRLLCRRYNICKEERRLGNEEENTKLAGDREAPAQ